MRFEEIMLQCQHCVVLGIQLTHMMNSMSKNKVFFDEVSPIYANYENEFARALVNSSFKKI